MGAMSRSQKVRVLKKRAAHLAERAMRGKVRGRVLSFDEQELAALIWAINALERNTDVNTTRGDG